MEIPHIGLLSPAALAVLNRQPYDPAAKGQYEYMAGGLMWRDELPLFGSPERKNLSPAFVDRYLIAYRAALTLGDERIEFRHLWEQVARDAPNWPGLRPERRGESARKRLIAAKRIEARCFEVMERQMV